jgi:hypothetical protein
METRNLANGSLKLKDGAGTPKVLVVPIDEGNVTFDETIIAHVVLNRDVLDHQTDGEEMETPVSFTMKFAEFLSQAGSALGTGAPASTCSPADFIDGTFAGLTSTSGRTDVYTSTLEFTIANPATTGDQNEVLTFTKFHVDRLRFKEGAQYNTLIVEGRALITAPSSARA